MGKSIKTAVSLLLVAVLLISAAPISGFKINAYAADFQTGDIIEFGSYPQAKVTDEILLARLDEIEKEWISYGYYSGTGTYGDGKMAPDDYMKYCDITLDGEKYRAVFFDKYRGKCTHNSAITTVYSYNIHQSRNGYLINTVYYFKYEPLQWRILDPETGMLLCESIIDSQAFNNYMVTDEQNINIRYGDPDKTYSACNWEYSSIRAWLNDDFLNTAFTKVQQNKIQSLERETVSPWNSEFSSNPTTDKITLLSYREALTKKYGLNTDYNAKDPARFKTATDYAKCQGVYYAKYPDSDYGENKPWMLRTASNHSFINTVCTDGKVTNYYIDCDSSETFNGIAPVLNLVDLSDYEADEPNDGITWTYSNGCLTINGSGDMAERKNATDFEWYSLRNDVTLIKISDSITSVSANAFKDFTKLGELYLGKGLKNIAASAFSGCENLAIVTVNGKSTEISSSAFDNGSEITVIGKSNNGRSFAEQNGFNYVSVAFDVEKKVLNFSGKLTVYKAVPYFTITSFVVENSNAEYLCFDKLVFDGVESETISIDNVDPAENYLTLNNLYVSLKMFDGNQISFAKMLEMLENGEYDNFKFVIQDDDNGKREETFWDKVTHTFDAIFTSALKTFVKITNFFRNLFK